MQQTSNSGFNPGNACYVNSPNNVSVANGHLDLTVRAEAAPFTCSDPSGNFTTQYTAGQVTTYGIWPNSGEIDFAEFYSLYPNLDIPYIHYNEATNDPNVTAYNCNIGDITQFHTYAVEWTPAAITTVYDGKTCMVDHWDPASPLVAPQPFDQPFIISLTQALGVGTNAFDPSATPLPAATEIDYVRAWK